MNGKPEDDPLGATPVLPPPSGAAANRASKAFREYVDHVRAPATPRQQRTSEPGSRSPSTFGGGRRYDLALSLVQPTSEPDEETRVMQPPDPAEPADEDVGAQEVAEHSAPAVERPPPGVPTVRPPVQRAKFQSVSQELLETTADTALLTSSPDGGATFDIVFNDELFENLACRITVDAGRVVATFRVRDENTRRLLEAETGMLRARFEERGLKVSEIKVELGSE